MKKLIAITFILALFTSASAVDFFSTAYVETYRTDSNTTMVSPNVFFQLGRLEGYGFIDRYLGDQGFYHGEFLLAFQPFTTKYFDRFSIITESRWDKSIANEHSLGIRVKLW
ncbi:MAG: hypothetical protein HQ591_07930 [candidate division Zixibacteria bacterium]|nr:hypothetical protein [Candidatus Tariuqbacter arcticus]